jgi:hypothetical protein
MPLEMLELKMRRSSKPKEDRTFIEKPTYPKPSHKPTNIKVT